MIGDEIHNPGAGDVVRWADPDGSEVRATVKAVRAAAGTLVCTLDAPGEEPIVGVLCLDPETNRPSLIAMRGMVVERLALEILEAADA